MRNADRGWLHNADRRNRIRNADRGWLHNAD